MKKISNKLGKYGMGGMALLIVSSLIVCGAVFTFLWSGTITAEADYLIQYDDGGGMANAEDLTVNIATTDLVAGETHTFEHDWQVNTKLDSDLEAVIDFSYVANVGSDDLTGIDLYIYCDDGTTNTTVLSVIDGVETDNNDYTVVGGDTGTVFVKIVADDHLKEGSYLWDYNVDVTVQDLSPP